MRDVITSILDLVGVGLLIGSVGLVISANSARLYLRDLNRHRGDTSEPENWTRHIIARQVTILKWGQLGWLFVLLAFLVD